MYVISILWIFNWTHLCVMLFTLKLQFIIFVLFSSLTDESDKYSLSKAVSAPLKSNKYYQTDKVADRTSNPVQKRNSWDEVSNHSFVCHVMKFIISLHL